MKALVRYGKKAEAFEVREMPVPEIAPDEVLVKVAYAGICGTDPHTYRSEDDGLAEPLIQGHEYSGTIEAVGEEVTDWAVGDRVAPESCVYYCGKCFLCRTGQHYLCRDSRTYSYGIHGVFAEYAQAPARILHRVPEGVSLLEASLSEPFCVSYQAVIAGSTVQPGDTVVVVGPGPIGVFAVICAHLAGAGEIVVVGTSGDDRRLELAQHYGATITINSSREDALTRILSLGDRYGADLVVDAAGPSSVLELSINAARPGGQITKVALGRAPVGVELDLLIYKNLTLKGHYGLTWDTWEVCLTLMATGQADLKPMVTHQLPLDEWQKGFELIESKEAMKVVLATGCADLGQKVRTSCVGYGKP